MIQYVLKNMDFTGLSGFLSPNFFKVVSPTVVMKIATQILRNRSDQAQWNAVLESLGSGLEKESWGLQLVRFSDPASGSGGGAEKGLTPQEMGHQTLKLFFYQVLTQDTWVLDLRTDAFQVQGAQVGWSPSSIYFRMEPKFLEGVRSLYRGFYTCNDALFDSALEQLQMDPAKQSLRAHFGTGDQKSVPFQLKKFQETFTRVFEDCARSRRQLQGEFFVLGILLVSLYERLEKLGVEYDVRSCFDAIETRRSS